MMTDALYAFAGLCLLIALWAAYEIVPACLVFMIDWAVHKVQDLARRKEEGSKCR